MINDENENSEVKGAHSTTNSDALTAKPRPGGYSGSSKADESIPSFCVCENDSEDDDDDDGICSKRSMRSSKPSDLPIITSSKEMRYNNEEELASIRQDTLSMLAVTISSVMLMAAEAHVSEEHLRWTEKYLTCIKDEHGNRPPNVQKVLNHILWLKSDERPKGGGRKSGKEDDGEEGGSKGSPGRSMRSRIPKRYR